MTRAIIVLILCANCAFCALEFQNYNGNFREGLYLISEKFDGIRAIWDTKTLKTKRGNEIFAPKCFIDKLPKIATDGELWIDYNKFSALQSVVSSKNSGCVEWSEVKYLIFDAPSFASLPLSERLAKVREVLGEDSQIRLIEQIELEYSDEMEVFLKEMLEIVAKRGGEGLIIRRNDEPYANIRSKDSQKLKPAKDAECEIIAYSEGKGKFEGKVGAFICRQKITQDSDLSPQEWEKFEAKCVDKNPCEVEITFKIGSGLSDEIRANPPKIGTIITYKYSGFSENGIPKHSVFLRVFGE